MIEDSVMLVVEARDEIADNVALTNPEALRPILRELELNPNFSNARLVFSGGESMEMNQLLLGILLSPSYRRSLSSDPYLFEDDKIVLHFPDVSLSEFQRFLDNAFLGSLEEVSFSEEPILRLLGYSEPKPPVSVIHLKKENSLSPPPALQPPPPPLYSSQPPKKRKAEGKRSMVWKYFDRKENVNVCLLCNVSVSGISSNTSAMIQHLRRHHPDIPFSRSLSPSKKKSPSDSPKKDEIKTCPDCGKDFSTKKNMIIHRKTVHCEEKPYTCELCGSSFARVDSFRSHVVSIHSDERPFLCTVCGKTFKTRSTRNMHERVHRGDKRYPCSYCPKGFITNQQKTKHERTHTGEKPHECQYCHRFFKEGHHLKTHLVVHTGDKPYKCPHCLEEFKYLSSRNKHKCPGGVKSEDAILPDKILSV